MLPGRVSLADGRDWFESQWGELPTTPGLDTRGMLEAAVAGTLQTLVLLGADPLSDFPDRSLAARALEEVPFLVAIETVPSASGRLADVVLPAAGFAERGGTTTNLEGRVTHLTQKVVPPGTARPDWVIAVEVAERLGFDLGFESLEGIWEEIEQVAPAHRGVTVEAVYGEAGQDGVVLPVKARAVGLPGRRRRLDPMATPGIQAVNLQGAPLFAGSAVLETGEGERRLVVDEPEKTELPAEAGEEPERPAARPGPVAFAPDRWQTPARPVEDAESLRLVLRRSLYDRGSLLEASPSLAPLVPAQQLRLPLEEIDRLGLSEGEEVRVRSGRGELVAPVRRDASLPPGVAVLSHNVQGEEEGGANLLVDADEPCQTVRLESVGG
jgi:predicted molibdopterin-dependent oxidoreductase YjgC